MHKNLVKTLTHIPGLCLLMMFITESYLGQCSLIWMFHSAQSAFTYSKLTIETLEQGVKYVQS